MHSRLIEVIISLLKNKQKSAPCSLSTYTLCFVELPLLINFHGTKLVNNRFCSC